LKALADFKKHYDIEYTPVGWRLPDQEPWKRLKATSAAGATGCLLMDLDGEFFFRVYRGATKFIDYWLLHNDFRIEIADDEQALFYVDEDETRWLDYSPEVLGLEEISDKPPTS